MLRLTFLLAAAMLLVLATACSSNQKGDISSDEGLKSEMDELKAINTRLGEAGASLGSFIENRDWSGAQRKIDQMRELLPAYDAGVARAVRYLTNSSDETMRDMGNMLGMASKMIHRKIDEMEALIQSQGR